MTKEEFIDIVYNELHSDEDNYYRANRIIDAADKYEESELECVLNTIQAEIDQSKKHGKAFVLRLSMAIGIIDRYRIEREKA